MKMKKEKQSESFNKILNNLKALRAIKNYSQEFIADKLGCDYSTYGKLENGKTELTINRLFMLADIFGVSVNQLMFEQVPYSEKSMGSGISSTDGPKLTLEIPLNSAELGTDQIKQLLEKLLAK